MNVKDIKIGWYYKIVGGAKGCDGGPKCRDCRYFKYGIKILKFDIKDYNGYEGVPGKSLHTRERCRFSPRDLKPLTWKQYYDVLKQIKEEKKK